MSVTKQLFVYVRSSFISVRELSDGTAPSTVAAVCKLCEDLDTDMSNHLCGLGSDGASVMLGVCGGVSKLLKDKFGYIAHRLALACLWAVSE